MPRRFSRSLTLLVCARYAWVLWTGTASALQSSAYGNVGPVGSWTKLGNAPDFDGCGKLRKSAMEDFLRTHPQAVKRDDEIMFEKRPLPGDEEMIVHTATSFVCLPEGVDAYEAQAKTLGAAAAAGGAGAPSATDPPSGGPAPSSPPPSSDAAPGASSPPSGASPPAGAR